MNPSDIMARVWHEIGCANRPFQSTGARNPRGTTFEDCKFRHPHEKTAKEAFRRMADVGWHLCYTPPEAGSIPMFGDAP